VSGNYTATKLNQAFIRHVTRSALLLTTKNLFDLFASPTHYYAPSIMSFELKFPPVSINGKNVFSPSLIRLSVKVIVQLLLPS